MRKKTPLMDERKEIEAMVYAVGQAVEDFVNAIPWVYPKWKNYGDKLLRKYKKWNRERDLN